MKFLQLSLSMMRVSECGTKVKGKHTFPVIFTPLKMQRKQATSIAARHPSIGQLMDPMSSRPSDRSNALCLKI